MAQRSAPEGFVAKPILVASHRFETAFPFRIQAPCKSWVSIGGFIRAWSKQGDEPVEFFGRA